MESFRNTGRWMCGLTRILAWADPWPVTALKLHNSGRSGFDHRVSPRRYLYGVQGPLSLRPRRFSFRSPEIRTGKRCNCSLCLRRGAVLSSRYIPNADFTPHHDPSELGVYLWNEKVLNNYFCKSCGIFVYIGDGVHNRDGYRVNLGCVE